MLAGCSALADGEDTVTFYDGDWRQYGNGSKNANRVAGGAPEPDEQTSLTSAGWAYAPPVVYDGVVYFATARRVVGAKWFETLRISSSRKIDSPPSDSEACQ